MALFKKKISNRTVIINKIIINQIKIVVNRELDELNNNYLQIITKTIGIVVDESHLFQLISNCAFSAICRNCDISFN